MYQKKGYKKVEYQPKAKPVYRIKQKGSQPPPTKYEERIENEENVTPNYQKKQA